MLLAVSVVAEQANGQSSRPITVIVAVLSGDSAQATVPDADLVIIEGLAGVLGRTKSDSSGFARLTVRPTGSTIQLSVRRFGFAPIARFIQLDRADTVVTEVDLSPAVQSLAAVTTRAAQDPVVKSYYIDADAIEASGRPVYSALDIMSRLRPDTVGTQSS